VRWLELFNSNCGQTGTLLKVCPAVALPRRVHIHIDGTPDDDAYEHQYFPPPHESLELETPAERYTGTFTREVERLLESHIYEVIRSDVWDMTEMALWLHKRTGVDTSRVVRTLCWLVDEGFIAAPSSRYFGGPYLSPTRLRIRAATQ